MKTPRISVIMPTYNTPENFFRGAVESILNQSYENLELIVVDDGSVDNHIRDIVKTYQDPRLLYINEGHNGAGPARNIGIKHARGDWIYIMASDDTVDKDMFKVCIDLAEKYTPDIVLFNLVGQCNDGKISIFSNPVPLDITNPGDTTQLVRKDLVVNNNIVYENLTSCNDVTFTYTILACAKKVVKIDRCFYYYNLNVPNQISSNRGSKAKNIFMAFDALKRNLESKGLLKIYEPMVDKTFAGCVKYELSCITDKKYKQEFISILKRNYRAVYRKVFRRHIKLFHKQRLDNGKRVIYILGKKIFSYHKQFVGNVSLFDIDIQKYNACLKHRQSIENLILGSSTARDGFLPTCDRDFNLGSSSQDLYHAYHLYKWCLDQNMPNLKNIVLFFDVFTPGFQLEKTKEAYKSIIYKILYKIPYAFKLHYRYHRFAKKLKKYVDHYSMPIPTDYYGESFHDSFDNMLNVRDLVCNHMKNNIRKNDAMAYLEKLFLLARKNNHNVFIVIPPYRNDNLSCLEDENVVFSALYSVIDKYNDVKVLSFLESKKFKESDFGDCHHLNKDGAKKLTECIKDKINLG